MDETRERRRGIDYERLYAFRFRDVDQRDREQVWSQIAPWVHARLGSPQRVLDPAAGRCEFINAVPAPERWAVDEVDYGERWADPGVRFLVSDALEAELPAEHFDAVWVSNFLEHLPTQDTVAEFLSSMRERLRTGGRIAIMGPNFRYCPDEYFDCADHTLALTHVAVSEHVYAAGFEISEEIPRFLPYSFRSRFPASARLTRAYLALPPLWRLMGKQFLIVGRKPAAS